MKRSSWLRNDNETVAKDGGDRHEGRGQRSYCVEKSGECGTSRRG